MNKTSRLFNKRRAWIIVAGAILSAVLVYFFTGPLFVSPVYEAESVFYVPLTIPSKQIEQQGIGFASDREIDGHIQILKSSILRDSLISRFALARVYGIDLNQAGGLNKIHGIVDKHLKIRKTRYSSVSVKFTDADPERAAELANAVVTLGDKIKEALLYANRQDALDYATTLYERKEEEVLEMELVLDSLNQLSGIENRGSAKTLLTKMQTMYDMEIQELAGRKNHLEREQKSFEAKLPTSYVITHASANYHPVFPPRVLMALAAAAVFVVMFLTILIINRDEEQAETN